MSLNFSIVGNKPTLQVGQHHKELTKEAMLEVLQLVLSHVAGTRDYTNVVSVGKLLKIIELECEPDDSDSESEPKKPASTQHPVPVVVTGPSSQEVHEEPVKRTAPRAQRRPALGKKDDE